LAVVLLTALALFVGTAATASACSYVAGVQFVGFRGTIVGEPRGDGGTYDVDFVVSEVFTGTVPRHVTVRFVPPKHLAYVRMKTADIHATGYKGEFDWSGPCDSPDFSTTPFTGVGYPPAADLPAPPSRAPSSSRTPIILSVAAGGSVILAAVYLAIRRGVGRRAG
jgi:hypothetical protein